MKSESRKAFHLYLSEAERDALNKRADELKMSLNSYVRHAALSYSANMEDMKLDYKEGGISDRKTFELELSGAEHQILRLVSTEMGLTMSEYLRNCIRLKKLQYVKVCISHNDLDEHTMMIGELLQNLMSLCNMITRTQNAFPQEIAKIIKLLEEINEKNKQLLDVIYADRKRLYREAKKELLNNLR